MDESKKDELVRSLIAGDKTAVQVRDALKLSAQNTVRARKNGFMAVTLSFCDAEVKGMTPKKAISIIRAIRRQFQQYADKVSGYYQVVVVLADWHHGRKYSIYENTPLLGDGYGTNGRDLHFHMMIYGTPKDAIVKEVLFPWWGKKWGKYYSFRALPDGAEAQTIKYQNNADLGWRKYMMDNMIGSSESLKEQAGRSLVFRFSTAGKENTWKDIEWTTRLPPVNTRINIKEWERQQYEANNMARVSLLKSLNP